ncbi:gamma-glutamyl-gamma-aminobutyrate hydrolase family protein [Nocardioides sp. GY 10113]|uniref:gamma-glutamyl-gamma-aminobutyrate hydrolase family protein n=1 Tax=Nocardioides sp. GY 10113 TaxID=2569761 RepID=UPI0010A84453|nr:gamma-glutamyl-gamma-aminobutyrate hydrolase family protein [Nocardioides sp. GY 10113]TIC87383.1 gamma-glutamyl-gamma-aminobutyrate hydrolase family protein [Nocardioides sp. GY 10113]
MSLEAGGERPRILIPARFSGSASALRYAAEVTSRNLVEAVWAAGGEPLVVHPHAPGGVADDAEVARRLAVADGVLLPGGGDLAGRWSGQPEHETLYDVDVEQDAFDLAVARVCLERGIPLLAICRGLQVVNVARGGRVVQDMDEAYGEMRHHRHRVHSVAVDAGSLLAGVVGDKVEASCYHHQCLAELGEGMAVVARAEDDVIEAVEIADTPGWFLGVQWHPEDTWAEDEQQLAVLRGLVDAAR